MKKPITERIEDLFYQRIVRPLLFTSRLGRKVMLGYADTGTNFDHIYKNKAKGYTKFGKVVDRVLLNLPAAKATRFRKELIKKLLSEEIAQNIRQGRKTRLVDFASGPARYLVELLTEEFAKQVEFLCLDADLHSIDAGKTMARGKPILYKKSNVLKVGRRHGDLAGRKNWLPNIVISSGLIEYLDDETSCSVLQNIHGLLEEKGLLFMITQRASPNRKLIEKVGITKSGKKWLLFYREPQLIAGWLRMIGYQDVSWEVDPWGMYVFYRARRGKA